FGQAERLAQEPAKAITRHGVADLSRHRQAEAAMGQFVAAAENRYQAVADRAAGVIDAPKIERAAQVLGFAEAEGDLGIAHVVCLFHGMFARGVCGLSLANSSINCLLRSSPGLGTITVNSRYWSPPLMPLPRRRRRLPLLVPGGTVTVRV